MRTVLISDIDSRYFSLNIFDGETEVKKNILKNTASAELSDKNILLRYTFHKVETTETFDEKEIDKPAGESINEKCDAINLILNDKEAVKLVANKEEAAIDSTEDFVNVEGMQFKIRPRGRCSFVIYGKAKCNGTDGVLFKMLVPEGSKMNARLIANKTKIVETFSYFLNEVKTETSEPVITADGKALIFSITGSIVGGTDGGIVQIQAKGNVKFLPGYGATVYEF